MHGPADKVKIDAGGAAQGHQLLERNLIDDGGLVRIGLRANDAQFQTDRAMIYTTLVQGSYAPYRDIITKTRKDSTVKIPLPVEAFYSRVRQATIMTDEESKRVDMTFAAGQGRLQARGARDGFERSGTAAARLRRPGGVDRVRPDYLVEFLRALEGETTITLEMSGGDKPALFRCGENYLYLVMPLAG